MKTSETGKDLIIKFEGVKLNAYRCPAGVVTIGAGNTYYLNGNKVKLGDKITQERANELFLEMLPKYEAIVDKNIKVILNQNQYDALVSFCWNCGSSDSLFRLVNQKAADEIIYKWWSTHYIMGGGKVLAGLVRRRRVEADLFVKK